MMRKLGGASAVIGLIVVSMLCWGAMAWAMQVDTVVASEGNDILALLRAGLTSVPGIVALSMALMVPVKKHLGTVRVFQDLPAWAYVLATSLVLTVFANRWLGTLSGDIWPLLVDAFWMATSASGLREWIEKLTVPLGDTAVARKSMERKARG